MAKLSNRNIAVETCTTILRHEYNISLVVNKKTVVYSFFVSFLAISTKRNRKGMGGGALEFLEGTGLHDIHPPRLHLFQNNSQFHHNENKNSFVFEQHWFLLSFLPVSTTRRC